MADRRRALIVNATSSGSGSRLPSGYQEVEYIESTGTQYIMTNIYHDETTEIICDIMPNQIAAVFIYGSRTTAGQKANSVCLNSDRYSTWCAFYSINNDTGQFPFSLLTKYTVINGKNGFYVDNQQIYNYGQISGNYISDYPLAIFALLQGTGIDNRKFNGKIYLFKVYKNDILTNNLVPCYRKSDNEIGMYDTINNVFYTNAGTGIFLKGADVN